MQKFINGNRNLKADCQQGLSEPQSEVGTNPTFVSSDGNGNSVSEKSSGAGDQTWVLLCYGGVRLTFRHRVKHGIRLATTILSSTFGPRAVPSYSGRFIQLNNISRLCPVFCVAVSRRYAFVL